MSRDTRPRGSGGSLSSHMITTSPGAVKHPGCTSSTPIATHLDAVSWRDPRSELEAVFVADFERGLIEAVRPGDVDWYHRNPCPLHPAHREGCWVFAPDYDGE